jgi:hypothetical protein
MDDAMEIFNQMMGHVVRPDEAMLISRCFWIPSQHRLEGGGWRWDPSWPHQTITLLSVQSLPSRNWPERSTFWSDFVSYAAAAVEYRDQVIHVQGDACTFPRMLHPQNPASSFTPSDHTMLSTPTIGRHHICFFRKKIQTVYHRPCRDFLYQTPFGPKRNQMNGGVFHAGPAPKCAHLPSR